MNAPERSALRPRVRCLRSAFAVLLLLLPALGLATTCRLEFAPASPLTLPPNDTTALTLRAVDTGPGACTGANFNLAVLSDSTSGASITPVTGSVIEGPTGVLLSVSTPPNGGGSITWQAQCLSGCEASMPVPPEFTLNVGADVYTLAFAQPTAGTAPIAGGQVLPLAVQVLRNGTPSPNIAERTVCFEFSPDFNPNGAALTGGSGPCGAGGSTAVAPINGDAGLTLAAAPTMCSETRVRATATGFPVPQTIEFVLQGSDPLAMLSDNGAGQSTPTSTAFAQPLATRLRCAGGAFLSNKPLRWEVSAGSSVVFADGSTLATAISDGGGGASIAIRATATPGPATVRACPDFPPGCAVSAEFDVTALSPATRSLEPDPLQRLEGPPGAQLSLAAFTRNDGLPAQDIDVAWQLQAGGGSVAAASTASNVNGAVFNTFSLPATPGASSLRLTRADAAGLPLDLQPEAVVYSLQAAGAGTSPQGALDAPIEVAVQVLRQAASLQSVSGVPVSFSLLGAPAGVSLQPVAGGLSDNAGIARAQLTASSPGTYTVRADFSPGGGFPTNLADFSVQAGSVGGPTGGELRVVEAPPFLYTEEASTEGVAVRLESGGQPVAGVRLRAKVESEHGRFAGGLEVIEGLTDTDGRFLTPPLIAERRLDPIVVGFEIDGGPAARAVIEVRASTYSLELRPPAQAPQPGRPSLIEARLLRRGSVFAQPVANALLQFGASGGQLQPERANTDENGEARLQFTPDAAGSYALTARFEPGAGLPVSEARLLLSSSGLVLRAVSGDGQTAPAGSTLPQPLVVEATRNGTPAADVELQLTPVQTDSAVAEPASLRTDASGRAQFGLRLGSNARGRIELRLREAAGGAELALFAIATEPQGPRLDIVSGDAQDGVAGSLLAQPLRVRATDNGRPRAGLSIRFELQPTDAGSLEPTSALTDSEGFAETRLRLASTANGALTVLAQRADAASASARFSLSARRPTEQRLQIDGGNGQRGVSGRAGQDLVVRYTVDGQPAAGAQVDWQVLSGNLQLAGDRSETDANGQARMGLRFGTTPGEAVVQARLGALDVRFTLSSEALLLRQVDGDGQRGLAGEALQRPLRVRVEPALAGERLRWEVLEGGGRVEPASTSTDANGEASAQWILGEANQPQRLRVQLDDGSQALDFTAVSEGRGGTLEIVSGNAQTVAPGVASAPLVLRAIGDGGRPLAQRRLRFTAENARLDRDSAETDAEGRAQLVVRVLGLGAARVRVELVDSEATLEFTLNGALAALEGLSPRQRELSGALDTMCPALAALPAPSAAQRDLLARCDEFVGAAGSDAPGLRQALDQLPNDVGLNLARAGDESMRGQIGNLDQRQRALRGGGRRLQFDFALGSAGGSLPLSVLPLLSASAEEAEVGADFERWGAFVTGSLGRGRSRGNGLQPSFEYDLGSLTAGVDYRFGERWVIGAALGLNRDDTDYANGRGTLESRGSLLSAYASVWLPQAWYLDGSLSLGRNRFDLERRIGYSLIGNRIDQRAEADTDGDLFGASLALGRDWQLRAWSVGGYLRAQYSQVDYDAFEERLISGRPGEGLGLHVESPRWESLETVVGMRGSRARSFDWGVLLPSLLIEYSREHRDDPSRLDMRFLADPTRSGFSQRGAAIDQSHVNLGLGLTALFPGGRSAFFQYERRMADDNISHWLLSLGGRFEF